MKRKDFLKAIAMAPIAAAGLKLGELSTYTDPLEPTEKMPVIFFGHGSPMNALEENEFVQGWRKVMESVQKPRAILCVSAHWETRGTWVTAMEKPKTIHDFGGFPQALFDVEYKAPGSPAVAGEVKQTLKKTETGLDQSWGLDHGCWSVVMRIYPEADIPVLQLSLDYTQPAQYHYELARELAALREKGILIVGSGNIVHNLRQVNFGTPDKGFDWAVEAREKLNKLILDGDHQSLVNYQNLGSAVRLAAPYPDHYLPLLYTLALKGEKEEPVLFNDRLIYGSLSMTGVRFG